MNAGDLYDRFRLDVVDQAKPYLWSDDEVFGYMDTAYQLFVRDTEGIADTTSAVTVVNVTAGQPFSDVDPSILNFRQAFLASTNEELTIVNAQEMSSVRVADGYGVIRSLNTYNLPGPVRYMVIGLQRDKVRWAQIPVVNDTVNLVVYRLPLLPITDPSQEFEGVAAIHHLYFLDGMKALAYRKQDAETFDRARANECEMRFTQYCAKAKAEWSRYKAKVRTVVYGGI